MKRYILFLLFQISQVNANCILSKNEDSNYYEFLCDGKKITQSCSQRLTLCEYEINEKLEPFKFHFKNNKLASISNISFEKTESTSCAIEKDSSQIECIIDKSCKSPIDIDRLNGKKLDILPSCTIGSEDESIEKTLLSVKVNEQLSRETLEKIDLEVNKYCKNIDDAKNISETYKSLFKSLQSKGFKDRCLQNATHRGIPVSNEEKDLLVTNLLQSMVQNYNFDLSSCGDRTPPLFNSGKLDLDRYVCLNIQKQSSVKNIKCEPEEGAGAFANESGQKNQSSITSRESASQNTATTAIDTPVQIPSSRVLTQPIPVQQTMAAIDKVISQDGGNGTEISAATAAQAGAIFEKNIYKPMTAAMDYVSSEIKKARAPSSVSSPSNRKVSLVGSTNPASKLKTTNRASASEAALAVAGSRFVDPSSLGNVVTDGSVAGNPKVVSANQPALESTSAGSSALRRTSNSEVQPTPSIGGASSASSGLSPSSGVPSGRGSSLSKPSKTVASKPSPVYPENFTLELRTVNSPDALIALFSRSPEVVRTIVDQQTKSSPAKSNSRAPATVNLITAKLENLKVKWVVIDPSTKRTNTVYSPREFTKILQQDEFGQFRFINTGKK